MALAVDRRSFLAGAGATFLASFSPASAETLLRSSMLFVSGFMDAERNYGIAVLDQDGNLVHRQTLPGRAHGFAHSPAAGIAIGFARRPGNFAIAFDPQHLVAPVIFHAPEGRHFFGHGTFSTDGKLLYATENDFEAGAGKIGIYDVKDGFRRIGEFDTFGTGPHEIILMRDGRTLAVANGGIRTHPDFGRAKLNLAEMQSNIALVDINNGDRLATFELPERFQRMSLRHMVHAADDSLWIGGQFEGDLTQTPTPVTRLDSDGNLSAVDLAPKVQAILSGYVGAVAMSPDGRLAAFSSPKGGGIAIFDTVSRKIIDLVNLPRTSGIAGTDKGVIGSSEDGVFAGRKFPVHWDNHITSCLPV